MRLLWISFLLLALATLVSGELYLAENSTLLSHSCADLGFELRLFLAPLKEISLLHS